MIPDVYQRRSITTDTVWMITDYIGEDGGRFESEIGTTSWIDHTLRVNLSLDIPRESAVVCTCANIHFTLICMKFAYSFCWFTCKIILVPLIIKLEIYGCTILVWCVYQTCIVRHMLTNGSYLYETIG